MTTRPSPDNKVSTLVLDGAPEKGIKVDYADPTYGWSDLLGNINRDTGAAAPSFSPYVGNIKQWKFGANKEVVIEYHLGHDYALGTDIYIHVHWSQIVVDTGGPGGTPGTAQFDFEVIYAKGHDQAAFPGVATTLSVTQVASSTVRQHMIAEIQLSSSAPTANQIDTGELEPDAMLLVLVRRNGGDTLDQDPFIHEVDIHYQSNRIATKNKAPPFYA